MDEGDNETDPQPVKIPEVSSTHLTATDGMAQAREFFIDQGFTAGDNGLLKTPI